MHQRIKTGAIPVRPAIADVLMASALCCGITLILYAFEPNLRHWFVVPVTVCGILMSCDALPWLRGRRDLFDPVGIIGALGVHFFFLAPLLHVHWDYWMPYVAAPPDWRPWLGRMAVLNVAGLLVYRALIARRIRPGHAVPPSSVWRIDKTRFFAVGAVIAILTTLLQAWVYANNGGVSGYIERAGGLRSDGFAGMGWVFVICESGPIIGMMLFAVASDNLPLLRRPAVIFVALAAFTALSILFGGLRGSRSNTVWAVFWAAGLVHYRIRSLSRPVIVAGLIGLVGFMYVYGFYKNGTTDSGWALSSRSARLDLEAKTGRTFAVLLLGDLARSDIQAFELYRLTEARDDYELGWGRTYLGDLASVVPERLWPSRPKSKVVEGTNLLYGANAFRLGAVVASNVYGSAGESMLNFGPIGVLFGFGFLGFCVAATDRALRRWAPADARWLIAPVLVNLCFVVLVGDGDNVVGFLTKSLVVPAILLLAGTRRIRPALVANAAQFRVVNARRVDAPPIRAGVQWTS